MSWREEDDLSAHPKFFEYVDFFDALAKPECRDCDYICNFTSGFAVNTLAELAILSGDQTELVGINEEAEEETLFKNGHAFVAIVGECPGPEVVDTDMRRATDAIEFAYAGDQAKIDKKIAEILPLTTDCRLQKILRENDR